MKGQARIEDSESAASRMTSPNSRRRHGYSAGVGALKPLL
jgi:hypothetical protein